MGELLGLGYYTEIPAVVIDVQMGHDDAPDVA